MPKTRLPHTNLARTLLTRTLLTWVLAILPWSGLHAELDKGDTDWSVTWTDDWILIQDPTRARHEERYYGAPIGGGDGQGLLFASGYLIDASGYVFDNECFSASSMAMAGNGYTNGVWTTMDAVDRVVAGEWQGHSEGYMSWTGGTALGDYAVVHSTDLERTWWEPRELEVGDQGGTPDRPARSFNMQLSQTSGATVNLPPVEGRDEGERSAIPYDSGPILIQDCDYRFVMHLNSNGVANMEADGGCFFSWPALFSAEAWCGVRLHVFLGGECPVGWPTSGPNDGP